MPKQSLISHANSLAELQQRVHEATSFLKPASDEELGGVIKFAI